MKVLRLDAKACKTGTPCGDTCIEEGDTCLINKSASNASLEKLIAGNSGFALKVSGTKKLKEQGLTNEQIQKKGKEQAIASLKERRRLTPKQQAKKIGKAAAIVAGAGTAAAYVAYNVSPKFRKAADKAVWDAARNIENKVGDVHNYVNRKRSRPRVTSRRPAWDSADEPMTLRMDAPNCEKGKPCGDRCIPQDYECENGQGKSTFKSRVKRAGKTAATGAALLAANAGVNAFTRRRKANYMARTRGLPTPQRRLGSGTVPFNPPRRRRRDSINYDFNTIA